MTSITFRFFHRRFKFYNLLLDDLGSVTNLFGWVPRESRTEIDYSRTDILRWVSLTYSNQVNVISNLNLFIKLSLSLSSFIFPSVNVFRLLIQLYFLLFILLECKTLMSSPSGYTRFYGHPKQIDNKKEKPEGNISYLSNNTLKCWCFLTCEQRKCKSVLSLA